jgi:hypothetical protein
MMRTDDRPEPERIPDSRKPPLPSESPPDTVEFVRRMGLAAESAGRPPIPPAEFGVLGEEWLEGWKRGKSHRMRAWHDLFKEEEDVGTTR